MLQPPIGSRDCPRTVHWSLPLPPLLLSHVAVVRPMGPFTCLAVTRYRHQRRYRCLSEEGNNPTTGAHRTEEGVEGSGAVLAPGVLCAPSYGASTCSDASYVPSHTSSPSPHGTTWSSQPRLRGGAAAQHLAGSRTPATSHLPAPRWTCPASPSVALSGGASPTSGLPSSVWTPFAGIFIRRGLIGLFPSFLLD